ncbi:MAG TPA: protein-disulfide reductase DsbD domain-containing protein [Rhizomicrobium sp.]|nr:protein-disulfide reductase DsbD domain-containing protein [Rhizomicrobium sp.]
MQWLRKALLAIPFVCGAVLHAAAQIDSAPKVHARLVAEEGSVAPGQTVTVALEQDIRPGWHTYWRNPGDAGEATEIAWTLPPGWRAGPIAWPYPKELPVGPLMDYGYEGRPWLLVDVTAPRDVKPGTDIVLRAAANWLVCKEICIPESADLTLPLSISAIPVKPDPQLAAQFAAARALLPVASPWPMHFRLGGALDLFVAAPKLASAEPTGVHFFPFAEGWVKGIAPQQWRVSPDGLLLRLEPGKQISGLRALKGVLVLEAAGMPTQALTISATPGFVPDFAAEAGLTLPLAMLFALLGGVILNLMPCVLPILAMKALAIANKSGRTHEAAGEGLAYGAGAVLSFAVLGGAVVALRAGGQAIGWGFQLQQPVTVAAFALLVFAVGLNLSGVFEVPGLGAGEALARRGGHAGAFFTGVLAVAVAAPCTAPFMAAALGFALTQPALAALLVFVALGVGFAAPFVVIGFSPLLLRLLPKPGAWMSVFRQVLAFPMYGTALWLAWVLSFQTSSGGLIVLLGAALLLAFALWLVGAIQHSGRTASGWLAWAVTILAIIALAALVPMVGAGSSGGARAAAVAIPSQSYSEARLETLRAEKRGVFVDATAAWCVTCLVNEKVALDDSRVRSAFAGRHIALLVADWTNRDPQVTALLQAHARSGVPLYLYYKPGAADPIVLPQILTAATILAALGRR